MAVLLDVRDLLVASWEVGEADARNLVEGLEPAAVDGQYLVSVVGLGRVRARVGSVRLPPFSQVNVRTYAVHCGEPAVLFLRSWATPGGIVSALAGAPVGIARIRSRCGRLDVPAEGVRVAYELGGLVEAGPLGRHEVGLYRRGALRVFSVHRGPADWQEAVSLGEIRFDPLLSLGLNPGAPPQLVYARAAAFEIAHRPRKVDL